MIKITILIVDINTFQEYILQSGMTREINNVVTKPAI